MASSKLMFKRWLVLVGILLLLINISAEQPSVFKKIFQGAGQGSGLYIDRCKEGGEVQTLCQRCAKSTKSNIVYPMCCTNQEEARTWCDRYINFGIH